jgi:hypothetical protein
VICTGGGEAREPSTLPEGLSAFRLREGEAGQINTSASVYLDEAPKAKQSTIQGLGVLSLQ